MPSSDATIHVVQNLVNALKNTSPIISLVTLRNSHKEVLISIADIFGKSNFSVELPRVSIEESYLEKLHQAN